MGSASRIRESLRLAGAGFFVIVTTLALMGLGSWLFPVAPVWLIVPTFLLVFMGSILGALILFHGKATKGRTDQEVLSERFQLEQAGLISAHTFRALRAFQVEEFEDEGSQYFIELEDNSLFYLSGQFLYEYEPTGKKLRRFPCTEFTIRRHKDTGLIIDLVFSGTVLEPEITAPSMSIEELEKYGSMANGQIVPGKSYEEVKAEFSAEMRRRR